MTNPHSSPFIDQYVIDDFDTDLPSASLILSPSVSTHSSSSPSPPVLSPPPRSSFLCPRPSSRAAALLSPSPPSFNIRESTGCERVERLVEEIKSLQAEELRIKRVLRRKQHVLACSVMDTLKINNQRTIALHRAFMPLNKVFKTEPKLKNLIMKKINKTYRKKNM